MQDNNIVITYNTEFTKVTHCDSHFKTFDLSGELFVNINHRVQERQREESTAGFTFHYKRNFFRMPRNILLSNYCDTKILINYISNKRLRFQVNYEM